MTNMPASPLAIGQFVNNHTAGEKYLYDQHAHQSLAVGQFVNYHIAGE